MLLSAGDILPSQDFLKERTVLFIFECIRTGKLDELPPTPFVRKNEAGKWVAIDGHNLIAVRYYLNEKIEVISAKSATDALPEATSAHKERNKELAAKYDGVLDEQRRVAALGVTSFADLIAQYPQLFPNPAA